MTRTRLGLIAAAVVLAAALATYFFRPFDVASEEPRDASAGYATYRMPARDMEPTIPEGQSFLVDTAVLRSRDPAVGEIIVFQSPPRPEIHYIKRVVATGGSTIEMRAGVIWLDGKRLEEPWLPREPIRETTVNGAVMPLAEEFIHYDLPPTPVPEHYFFVLGDNRGNSEDSRTWGLVPRTAIIGVYARAL